MPRTQSLPATDLEAASGTQPAADAQPASQQSSANQMESAACEAEPAACPAPPAKHWWLLRAGDQRTIAALALAGVVALALAWLAAGGWSGGLVEIEQPASQPAEFRVDVNAAAWPELAQLPGIGPTLAGRIVDSRAELGPFRTPDDLLRVTGIGQKKLARLKPYLLPLAPAAQPEPIRGATAN
ncbi:MAG TPA: helix-hairpin-helix domain-containing protein [Pirellulales bacterium]|nr:helix-hairpin-helix domain-containing protein [Pirellulales bacterium]